MTTRAPKANGYILERIVVSPLATNCYVVGDATTRHACIIDPGGDPSLITAALAAHRLTPTCVILTHGHADHIAAAAHFKLPVYMHSADKDFLRDGTKNLAGVLQFFIAPPRTIRLVSDGDRIACDGVSLTVLHTPGHTPGSISLRMGSVVFTGDALFCGSIGRTDFPYGDTEALHTAIRAKLLTLDDATVIYPGHGEPSTIGIERRENPFLN